MDNISEQISFLLNEKVIRIEKILGGMTNVNYKVMTNISCYVLRIPDAASNLLVNRIEEKEVLSSLKGLNLDVETVFFCAKTGWKITRFVNNQFPNYIHPIERIKIASNLLKKLHHSNIIFKNKFSIIEKINFY